MKILYTVCLTCLILGLNAQFSIQGKVVNEQGEQLIGASVFLQSTKHASITDENGMFILNDVPAGNYMLKASFLAYEAFTTSVELDHDINLKSVVLTGGIYGLDEIEIKSTWIQEDQPFAQSSIAKEEIEKSNLGQDVPFVLKWSPSVVVNSDAGAGVGYTSMRIRGSDQSRINVTINGIPLNDAESQGVFWVDLPDFLSSVDQIQLQRGVGASTNGVGAFGASINLSTNQTNINPYATSSLSYGSFNTIKTSFGAGTGLMNGMYSIDARLSRINSDGYVDRASSDLESLYFSAARLTKKSSLRLNVFTGSEVTYQAWNGLPVQFESTNRTFNPSGTEKADEPHDNEVDDYNQTHVQLLFNRLLARNWKLNLGLHFTKGKGFFEQYKAGQDLVDYALNDSISETDLIRRRWLDNEFYGFIYALEKELGQGTLTLGGGLNNYNGRHFGEVIWTEEQLEIPDDHTYYDNDGEKLDVNIFVKMNHQLSERLNLYGDLQYRFINYAFLGFNNELENVDQEVELHFINPKLGLNYHINDHSSTFFSFAMGNKEPNRSDYTESTPNSRPEHESLYDFELGYNYTSSKIGLQLNLYNMIYKDQLVNSGRINDVGEYARENVEDSYRRGVELSLYVPITDYVSFSPGMTLSQNKIKSYTAYIDDWDNGGQVVQELGETDLSFSPSTILSSRIDFGIGQVLKSSVLKEMELSILTKYVGLQYIDNTSLPTSELDAYSYTDLRLHWPLPIKFLKEASLNVQLNNLFDAKYSAGAWNYRFKSVGFNPVESDPYAQSEGGDIYNQTGLYPQAGRNFLIGLNLRF